MGDAAVSLTFAEFKIGLCQVKSYSVAYSNKEGKKLEPKSIKFDSINREFTIYGQAGSADVFTTGKLSTDVVVEVTGTAGPDLSTSMQFVVTLSRDPTDLADQL